MSFIGDIIDSRSVHIQMCINNGGGNPGAGTTKFNFDTILSNMIFQPDIAIITSINYVTSQLNDYNIYSIQSDLIGGTLATFSGISGMQQMNKVIKIKKPIDVMQFNIQQISDGSVPNQVRGTLVGVTAITGNYDSFLTISIDFYQLENSKRHEVHNQISKR